MFVEFKDFIVLFDAAAAAVGLEAIPASNQAASGLVTEDIRALIGRTSPGKPVRYVVVSHHHGDHLGGVSARSRRLEPRFSSPAGTSLQHGAR